MGRMSGVFEYTQATMTIYFPKGEEVCAYCPAYTKNRCLFSQYPITPDQARAGRLRDCVLQIKEDDNGVS